MKRAWLLMLPLLLAAALLAAGCGGGGIGTSNNPQDTVNGFWDAYSRADFETAAQFVVSAKQAEVRSMQDEYEDDALGEEMLKLLMDKFKVKTTGHNIDGDAATVDAILSLPDLGFVFEVMFGVMFEVMMDEELDEAAAEQKMKEIIMETLAEAEIVDVNVTFDLVKEDGQWRLTDFMDLGTIMEEF